MFYIVSKSVPVYIQIKCFSFNRPFKNMLTSYYCVNSKQSHVVSALIDAKRLHAYQ